MGSVLALLLACASPAPAPGSVLLDNAPHVVQRPDFCGEACVEMALARLGYTVDQDAVFDASGVDPLLGRGLVTRELRDTLADLGFAVGDTWYPVPAEAQWDALLADLRAGVPSIVCMYAEEGGPEHFRLVLGYDAGTDEVVWHDPADVDGAYARMSRARFLALWPLGGHTIVRLRLEPLAPLRLPNVTDAPTAADYAQAVRRVRSVVPEGFTIVIEPPFVVIGNEPGATVEARAEGTVRRTTELLYADYFDARLDRPWEIWLFGDDATYSSQTEAIFGSAPTTPYGFADGNHRALVMNIGTGGGTLVHEMVHPFLAADFPAVASWFNEGLASLYEMSGEADGHLVGYPNWRLPGLQAAIRAGEVPDFRTFTAQPPSEFYGPASGRNYAQARYLCYYLQERGLLRRYYHLYRTSIDLTGHLPLLEVLGHPDMAVFQKEWEQFVLGLAYDR